MLPCKPPRASYPGLLGWALACALGLGGVLSAFGFDQLPYPLAVLKQAFNDAGEGGALSGSTVSGFSQADVDAHKTVTYAISYGMAAAAGSDTLGPLTFEDSLSTHMQMVGSVMVPTSWTSASTGSGTVNYSSPLLLPGSSASRAPSTPPTIATGNGGGDGYAPIIYASADGKVKRFFEIYHHKRVSAEDHGAINCQNFADGLPCAGYPKTLKNPASAKPYLGTAMWVHTVIIGTKLYYPANDNDLSVGIGCWDVGTDSNCTYIPLANKVNANYSDNTSGAASVAGVMQVPGQPRKLFLAQWGYLYCWDTSTNAKCGTGAATQFLTPKTGATTHFDPKQDQGHADLMVAGTATAPNTMLFALTHGWLTCMDLGTWPATTCNGSLKWPLQVTSMTGHDHNILSQYLDASGNVIGTCATIDNGWGNFNPIVKCYDTSGTALTVPAIFSAPGVAGSYFYISNSVALGTKVYYPLPSYAGAGALNGSTGATACWDFATKAACAGFTDGGAGAVAGLRRWNSANQGSKTVGVVGETRDYGYVMDGSCAYGLGDVAMLWSFDPVTGTAPCKTATDDVTVPDPKAFCDGKDHGSNWNRVVLNNTPPEISAVAVKVYDPKTCPASTDVNACTPLTTGDAGWSAVPTRPAWSIPFGRALSLKAYPELRVTYTYTFTNGIAPKSYPNFSVTTLYSADTTNSDTKGAIGQVCMRAQVRACPASVIDNLAIIKSATTGNVLGRGLWSIDTPVNNPVYSDTGPAIKNGSVLTDRVLFRATYQVTDWSGDLTAYATDASGNPGGATPWKPATSTSSNGGAAQMLPAASKRTILTTAGTGAPPSALSFDATSLESSLPATTLALFGNNATDRANLINYLRGDRSLEARAGTSNPYRRRMLWDTTGTVTALGDFVHSVPLYHNGMVYAAANDGMLHAFNAKTGVESFAFIPSSVFSLLSPLSEVKYSHSWIMDGQVAVAALTGQTMLVGSTGGVKPAIYGIDISGLPATVPGPAQVKFEVTHAALGRAHGAIATTNLQDGTAVALLGNGLGSAANLAQLIQVNLSSGAISAISAGVGSSGLPNGLSSPTPLVEGGALVAVYAGDAQGNLWRFPVTASGIGAPTKLFATAANQPITAAPAVTPKINRDGKTGHYVYIGTGQPVDRTDFAYDPSLASEQAQQTEYGLFDALDSAGKFTATAIKATDLVAQTFDSTGVASGNAVDLGKQSGWYINLDAGNSGAMLGAERVLSRAVYNADYQSLTFVTAIPQKSGCTNANLAGSHFVHVNAFTGGKVTTSRIVSATANEITITGTLGEIAPAGGNKMTNNITSDAGDSPVVDQGKTGSNNGALGNTNTEAIIGKPLKRTSWVQLY